MLLLDTDVMIDILREFSPAIKWLKSMEAEEIRLPGFVALSFIKDAEAKVKQAALSASFLRWKLYGPMRRFVRRHWNCMCSIT